MCECCWLGFIWLCIPKVESKKRKEGIKNFPKEADTYSVHLFRPTKIKGFNEERRF